MKATSLLGALLAITALIGLPTQPAQAQDRLTPAEARAIARDAYIYGFPMVDSYRIQYSYFVDKDGPEFKAPWNTLASAARVYTPEDKAIQAPNSDTPYSHVGADLRAEPLVITVPRIEKDRYYSIQFIDMYTYVFAYVGTRATGNAAGDFLLVGPDWKGQAPAGIRQVIRSETEFAFLLYRTQLKNPADIGKVEKGPAGYRLQPLSAYLGQPAPKAAPPIDFPRPLSADAARTSIGFFAMLDFLLRFCPVHPSEIQTRARFARIGVGAGRPFDAAAFPPDIRQAIEAGMADAWAAYEDVKKNQVDTGRMTTAEVFGSRDHLKDNYLNRMVGAVLGIYGHAQEEAFYPAFFVDADGRPLDGANRYVLRFAPGQLPPVDAFWSITMYELPSILLVKNPIDRYLINSPMLPDLKKDADGGLTIHVQHDSPGKDRESNWLPAPEGAFELTLRLYLPKPEALDGRWKAPPPVRLK